MTQAEQITTKYVALRAANKDAVDIIREHGAFWRVLKEVPTSFYAISLLSAHKMWIGKYSGLEVISTSDNANALIRSMGGWDG